MNNRHKKSTGYKELGKFLDLVWLGILTVILVFVYMESMSLDVGEDTAFPERQYINSYWSNGVPN